MKIILFDENLLSEEESSGEFIKLQKDGALQWIGDEEAYYEKFLKKSLAEKMQERFGNTVKYLRAIIDAQNAFVCILNEGEIIDGNQQFLQESTYGDINELYSDVADFLKVDYNGIKSTLVINSAHEWMRILMSKRDEEHWIRFKNDSDERYYEAQAFSTHYQSGVDSETYEHHNLIILHLRDLAIQIGMEKSIRYRDTLISQQAKNAAMGEMINNIAHQWRQPINFIGLLFSKLSLTYEYGKLDEEKLQEIVAKGEEAVQRMSQTIDDFRSFFSPNKTKKKFIIQDVIKNVLVILEPLLIADEIEVVQRVCNSKTPIFGFPNELVQVLLNLLGNAKDAMIENKIVKKTITIGCSCSSELVTITIVDNGGGIPDDVLPRIFEPYYTTKEQGKGTGIGLYMSQQIIEKNMGGRIWAENIEGGAKFVIELPITVSE